MEVLRDIVHGESEFGEQGGEGGRGVLANVLCMGEGDAAGGVEVLSEGVLGLNDDTVTH